jgi:hypothetical protein
VVPFRPGSPRHSTTLAALETVGRLRRDERRRNALHTHKMFYSLFLLFLCNSAVAQGPPDVLSFNSSLDVLSYWISYDSAKFKPLNKSDPAGPQEVSLTTQAGANGSVFSSVGLSASKDTIHAIDQWEAQFTFISAPGRSAGSGVAFVIRPNAPPTNTESSDMPFTLPPGSPITPGVAEVHFNTGDEDVVEVFLDRDFSQPICSQKVPNGFNNQIVNVWLAFSKWSNNTLAISWNFGTQNLSERPTFQMTCVGTRIPTLDPHVGFIASSGPSLSQQSILATQTRTCTLPNTYYNITTRMCDCLPNFVPYQNQGCQVPGYNEGLSSGEIAGIVLGTLAGVGLLAGALAIWYIKRKPKESSVGKFATTEPAPSMPVETSSYSVLSEHAVDMDSIAVKQYESYMANLQKSNLADEIPSDSLLGSLSAV